MPKRSNDFQKLITFVYERISPEGGKVTESGMVFDKEAGVEREVDILLENTIAGHKIRIAIECRDRARKDSVEWIDSIIGKTKSLDLNKIVAVSNSGFSEAAENKAKANNIDIVTYKEASEIDWRYYLFKPGFALISGENYNLKDVYYWDGSQFENIKKLDLKSVVFIDGEEQGDIKNCFEYLFQKHFVPFVDAYLAKNRFDLFKSFADCKKMLYLEKEIHISDLTVMSKNIEYDISRTKMIVLGTRKVNSLDQNLSQFQNKLISQSSFSENNNTTLKIKAIFDPDAEKIHFNLKRIDS